MRYNSFCKTDLKEFNGELTYRDAGSGLGLAGLRLLGLCVKVMSVLSLRLLPVLAHNRGSIHTASVELGPSAYGPA